MKVVKESIEATTVDYTVCIEYKSKLYKVVFCRDLDAPVDSYNNMELINNYDELSDVEIKQIKNYAENVWYDTDLFIHMNKNLIKRKYFV